MWRRLMELRFPTVRVSVSAVTCVQQAVGQGVQDRSAWTSCADFSSFLSTAKARRVCKRRSRQGCCDQRLSWLLDSGGRRQAACCWQNAGREVQRQSRSPRCPSAKNKTSARCLQSLLSSKEVTDVLLEAIWQWGCPGQPMARRRAGLGKRGPSAGSSRVGNKGQNGMCPAGRTSLDSMCMIPQLETSWT